MNNYTYLTDDVILGAGIATHAKEFLDLDRRVLIVTDSGVPTEYSEMIAAMCAEPHIVTVPQGENSKNFDQFKALLSAMLDASFTRKDCVVAVGGGVVGDMSGFAASCYMRGIDFYNIPTTFLSQIDSSIGGKTAIDFEGIKNIVGTFYNAKKVLIDPTLLRTLDRRQFLSGLAESIKIAAVRDKELFGMIEALPDIDADMTGIIGRSAMNKIEVVAADPKENGLRRILNFGHTIGHAIESFYGGKLLHGECVALGMLPMCSPDVREKLVSLYERFGLASTIDVAPGDVFKYLIHDKKAQGKTIKAVYSGSIGSFEIIDMSPDEILRRMEECL